MIKQVRGFSLLELMIVVMVIGIITAIAVPNLLQSKAAANEASAISSLRLMVSAQFTRNTNTSSYAPDLATLKSASLVDDVLGSGTKDGYYFSTSGGSVSFSINANPIVHLSTGKRSFFADQSGVIRYATANAPATSSDLPIG